MWGGNSNDFLTIAACWGVMLLVGGVVASGCSSGVVDSPKSSSVLGVATCSCFSSLRTSSYVWHLSSGRGFPVIQQVIKSSGAPERSTINVVGFKTGLMTRILQITMCEKSESKFPVNAQIPCSWPASAFSQVILVYLHLPHFDISSR